MRYVLNSRCITVRKATQEDVRYCFQLETRNMSRYNGNQRSFARYRDEFVASDVRIVMCNNRRCGFVEFQRKSTCWQLWGLQLSKPVQGKGLGTLLIQFVEREVCKAGGTRVELNVYTSNPAVRLYERLGYKCVKKLKGSKPERITMGKNLVCNRA